MPDELRLPATEQEQETVAGKEETALAAEVLQTMLKTSKAFRMYLPNNPLLHRFVEETFRKTTEHIEWYGEFRVDVEQFELKYRGNRILENRDPKESLPFRMFSDGIRSFSFTEGIESSEICDVLDILGRDRLIDSDDDIVTLLWMKDLSHVSYELTEDFMTTDMEGVSFSSAKSQGESIRRIYMEEEPAVIAPPVHRELHALSEEDQAALRAECEAEEKRNAHFEVTTIVSAILAGENDLQIVSDFLGIMENLVANLIRARQPGEALRLIRFLRKMEQAEKVLPEKKELIRRRAGSGVGSETVLALLPSLDVPDLLSPEDIDDFLMFFGPRLIGPMCELLALVQQMKARKAILAGLVRLGNDAPEAFFPFLADKRWFLVRNIVLILGQLEVSTAIDPIMRVATHSDLRVRKEVLAFLQKFSEPRARMGIVRFLQDENVHLRIRALQLVATSKFAPALKPVEGIAATKDFQERTIEEKRAVYEALGALSGDGILPHLRKMLKKRLLLGRGKERDDVICAVAAARRIRTPAAVQMLEEAEAERRGSELGYLVADALRELSPEKRGQ
jgi:hypothetical protein